jgi:3-hydroxy-3-methylglutaryl CoA synthase
LIGITSFGAYIPRHRLSRALIAREWGGRGGPGERAVANHDEDSATMAVEAALNCLEGIPGSPEGLLLATTTNPYAEKGMAGLAAMVLDLPREAFTADYSASLRAGTAALRSALEMVQSGRSRSLLIAAADCRLGEPSSDLEASLGDAAAALLVGQEGVIAELEATHSLAGDFTDTWRRDRDRYLQRGDPTFIQSYGHQKVVRDCVQGLLHKANLTAADIAVAVFGSPDKRAQVRLAKALGVEGTSASEALWDGVGDAGCATPLLHLAAALESAQPGERILLCSYGSGSSDAFLFRVTAAIEALRPRRAVAYHLARKRELPSYGKYLKFRQILAEEPLAPYASLPLSWREAKQDLQLYGIRCRSCGTFVYPRRRVCLCCGAKDDFQEEKLSRRGTVFTFTRDHLFPSPDPPIAMIVAEMEGGGRFFGQLTDADPAQVTIGMTVELTLRRLHQGGGFHHYFWKFRPA